MGKKDTEAKVEIEVVKEETRYTSKRVIEEVVIENKVKVKVPKTKNLKLLNLTEIHLREDKDYTIKQIINCILPPIIDENIPLLDFLDYTILVDGDYLAVQLTITDIINSSYYDEGDEDYATDDSDRRQAMLNDYYNDDILLDNNVHSIINSALKKVDVA